MRVAIVLDNFKGMLLSRAASNAVGEGIMSSITDVEREIVAIGEGYHLPTLESKIAKADLVIGGEGHIDAESLKSGAVATVLTLARKHEKPVILFCAESDINEVRLENDLHIYSMNMVEPNPDICKNEAAEVLTDLARIAIRYSGLF